MGVVSARLAERVALVGAGAGGGRLPAGPAPPPGAPAHDPRGGQARAQGIRGRSEPPGRAPAAAPRADRSNEWSRRSEKRTSSWSIPDHIAVALRYDRDGEAAPVVVARGERLLAERIKQVAREAGVPIFRDVTLARSLRDLPEGAEIPAALYEAVAEILRAVYAMAAPRPRAPRPSRPRRPTLVTSRWRGMEARIEWLNPHDQETSPEGGAAGGRVWERGSCRRPRRSRRRCCRWSTRPASS